MDFPSGFIPFFIQIITGISGFHAHVCTRSGFHHPPGLPLAPKLTWHTPHPSPGLVPLHPSPIDSKSIFRGKPCQNRHTFENSRIFTPLCTGPALTPPAPPAHYAVAWGDYLRTLAHPSAPFVHLCTPCTPLVHYCAPFRTHSHTLAHLRTPFLHL